MPLVWSQLQLQELEKQLARRTEELDAAVASKAHETRARVALEHERAEAHRALAKAKAGIVETAKILAQTKGRLQEVQASRERASHAEAQHSAVAEQAKQAEERALAAAAAASRRRAELEAQHTRHGAMRVRRAQAMALLACRSRSQCITAALFQRWRAGARSSTLAVNRVCHAAIKQLRQKKLWRGFQAWARQTPYQSKIPSFPVLVLERIFGAHNKSVLRLVRASTGLCAQCIYSGCLTPPFVGEFRACCYRPCAALRASRRHSATRRRRVTMPACCAWRIGAYARGAPIVLL